MTRFELMEKTEQEKEEEFGVKSDRVKIDGEMYKVSTVKLLTEELEGFIIGDAVDKVKEEGVYETSVFPYEGGEPKLTNTLYAKRYDTKKEAKKGHEEVLKKLENGKIDLE